MGRNRPRRRASRPVQLPHSEGAAEEARPGPPWWKVVLATVLPPGLIVAVAPVLVSHNVGGLSDHLQQMLGRDPLRVHATTTDELRPGPTRLWALDRRLDATRITDPVAAARLLRDGGAVPVRESTYEVTVENLRHATATITSIRAVTAKRLPPMAGAIVDARTGGGPSAGPVRLYFDLDDLDAAARDDEGGRYLDSAGLLLGPDEKLRFLFVGRSTQAYVEWDVEIGFIANGDDGVIRTTNGAPFRTTSVSPTYAEHYRWSGVGLSLTTAEALCAGDCRSLTP